MTYKHIHELYQTITDKNNFIIDIGAGGDLEASPVGKLLSSDKYRGVCFEPHPLKYPVLRQRISNTYSLCTDFVTPLSVLPLFDKYSVPTSPDILKIDIDGYDLEVLRTIVKKYQPKIIIAEINEKIPPPVLFEVLYKESYGWDESHFFGFSIASGEQFANDHNYTLLQILDVNNIILVHNDYAKDCQKKSLEEIYNEGYILSPERASFTWNADVNHWLHIKNSEELLGEIVNYFETNNNRSLLPVKTKKENVDFSIGIK
jgi:hypothetical protein